MRLKGDQNKIYYLHLTEILVFLPFKGGQSQLKPLIFFINPSRRSFAVVQR